MLHAHVRFILDTGASLLRITNRTSDKEVESSTCGSLDQ